MATISFYVYHGILQRMTIKWSFSINFFVKWSSLIIQSFHLNPKHSIIKGQICLSITMLPEQMKFANINETESAVFQLCSLSLSLFLKDMFFQIIKVKTAVIVSYGIGKLSELHLLQYSVDIFSCSGPFGQKQNTTLSGASGIELMQLH